MQRVARIAALALAAGLSASGACAAVVTITPSRDATLYATDDGSIANGAGSHLFIGRNSNGQTRRALLWFDLAGAIPQGATITGATLTLAISSGDGELRPATLHRVLADWGEGASDAPSSEGQGTTAQPGDATWLHTFYSAALWTTPGGDFVSAPSADALVGGAGSFILSGAGLVDDIQAWLDGDLDNFGWLLRGDESIEGTARRLDSRQNAAADARPALTVTYRVPAPGAGACLLGAGALAGRRRRRATTDRVSS